ncbi:MAG: tetratricopeptide repeat protein, partial [Planctomycetes bacterium]|nr:tetratricopeptide repeat protein [Planctomycetota bacterium]
VEGKRWIQQLQPRLDETPLQYHPKFLISAGHITWMYDLDAARQLFMKALDVAHDLGDRLQFAWAKTFLAFTMQQGPEAAQPVARESLALFRELDHQPGIAQALNIIGVIANQAGEDAVAKSAFHECLRVCQHKGEARRIGYMLHNLAYTAQHEGDCQLALDYGRQATQLARQRNDIYDLAAALHSLAGAWTGLAQAARAARLLGAHDAALERMGALFQPDEQRDRARIIASIQAQLDLAAFNEAMAEGRGMTLDQAVAYALED